MQNFINYWCNRWVTHPQFSTSHRRRSYCRKWFHFTLLQGLIDTKCVFWNYEFGWASSMHNWTIFQLTKVVKMSIQSKFLPYKLIGDATYSMTPWIYCPLKEEGDLTFNTKQLKFYSIIDTYMCWVTFGIFKCKWRTIGKRMDCPLCFILDVVSTCIILHNYAFCQRMLLIGVGLKRLRKNYKIDWFEVSSKKSKLLGEKASSTKIRGKIDTHPNMAILGRRMWRCEYSNIFN